jgi:hypothetical protein
MGRRAGVGEEMVDAVKMKTAALAGEAMEQPVKRGDMR